MSWSDCLRIARVMVMTVSSTMLALSETSGASFEDLNEIIRATESSGQVNEAGRPAELPQSPSTRLEHELRSNDVGGQIQVVIDFRPENIVTNVAFILHQLRHYKKLPVIRLEIASGDTVCALLTRYSGLPEIGGCPAEYLELVDALSDVSIDNLDIGDVVTIPDLREIVAPLEFVRTYSLCFGEHRQELLEMFARYSARVDDAKLYDRARGQIEHWRKFEVKDLIQLLKRYASKGENCEPHGLRTSFRGYRLRLSFDRQAESSYVASLRENSPSEIDVLVPEAEWVGPLYGTTPPEKYWEKCKLGNLSDGAEGEFLLDSKPLHGVVPKLPECKQANKPKGVRVFILDRTGVCPHEEFKDSLSGDEPQNSPSVCVNREVRASDNCRWTEAYDSDSDHGTHMAGMIAARSDGRGVTGLAPGIPIVSVAFKNDEYLVEKLNRFDDPTAPIGIVLFSSSFRDYPEKQTNFPSDIRVDHVPDLLNVETDRLKNPAARFVYNTSWTFLWVVAAGQPVDSRNSPLHLRKELALAPQNLGDKANVITVTACMDCNKEAGVEIDTRSNYSYVDADKGEGLVHVAAPGGRPIPSTVGIRSLAQAEGSSEAAAFVAGVAGRMMDCYAEKYKQPRDLKLRLQITSKPTLSESSAAKVATGVIDPVMALLDPSENWFIPVGLKAESGGGTSVEVVPRRVAKVNWLVDAIDLELDDAPGRVVSTLTKNIERLAQLTDEKWVIYHRPDGMDSTNLEKYVKVLRAGPGKPKGFANDIVQLEFPDGSSSKYSLAQIADLLLNRPVDRSEGQR